MDWHPQIIASRDPTVVALAWGVVATWWFGPILGATLALAATFGKRPLAPWRWIVRAMGFVFAISGFSASIACGVTRGFALELPDSFGMPYSSLTHKERLAFTQTAAMHETSYDAAAISTLLAAVAVGWVRKANPSPVALATGRGRAKD